MSISRIGRFLATSISLIFLTIFLILYYSPKIIILLALALSLYSLFLTSIVIVVLSEDWRKFNYEDLTTIAIFSSLLYTSNFFSMLIPSFIFYVVPFAAGLTFYFPASILYGIFKKICRKKGSSFLLLVAYGFISMFFSPAIFWFPYFLGWGSMLEIIGGDDCLCGIMFGLAGAGLAVDYMLVAWGYYRPIFIAIPAIIGDSLITLLGYRIGGKIGEELLGIIH